MKKRWFTLIEILVVIVIISILLALSLGITWGRVQILEEKYVQEEFVSSYKTLFSRNFLTNYYKDTIYGNLVVKIKWWTGWFSYSYNNAWGESIGQDFVRWDKYYITGLKLDNNPVSYVDIIFKPYNFGCTLSGSIGTWKELKMVFVMKASNKSRKQYCYNINYNLCRLDSVTCLDSDQN